MIPNHVRTCLTRPALFLSFFDLSFRIELAALSYGRPNHPNVLIVLSETGHIIFHHERHGVNTAYIQR